MSAALDVGILVQELLPLLDQLRALVPEEVRDPSRGTTSHHKAVGSPAPWHAEAGMLLYLISEEVRRLEASLRRDVAGHLGPRRGGSDANTTLALESIARLAHGVPEERARAAGRILNGWIRQVRQVPDIGLEERWVPVPTPPGTLPPPCPYCRTYGLRVAVRAGQVMCINRVCEDSQGERPRGRMDRSTLTGDPMISWADGRTITYGRDRA
ncbi:hypothetical protein ACLQ2R_03275 [Streptosporangium sp. DT93]|uniref:hypothetical protein n=1 Tax=Streptosporangium sp. DT93 TaxID=3393428 RepID=UPI003CFA8440